MYQSYDPRNPRAFSQALAPNRDGVSPPFRDPNYSQQSPFNNRGSVSSLSLPLSPSSDSGSNQFFQPTDTIQVPPGNPAPQPSSNNLFQVAAENLRNNGAWNIREEQRRWSERPGMGAGMGYQRPVSSFGLPPAQPLRNSMSAYDVGSNPRPRSASFQRPPLNHSTSSMSGNSSPNLSGYSSSTASPRSFSSGGALSPGVPQMKQMSLADKIQSDMRAKQAVEFLKKIQLDEEQRAAQARELESIMEGEVSQTNPSEQPSVSRTPSNVSHTSVSRTPSNVSHTSVSRTPSNVSHTTPSRVSSTKSTNSTSHSVPSRGASTASIRSQASSRTPVSPRPAPAQTSVPNRSPADSQIPESEEGALPPPLSPQVNLSPPAEEHPKDGDLIQFSETGEPTSRPRPHSYISDLTGIRPVISEEERPVSPVGAQRNYGQTLEKKTYQEPHANTVELPNQWNEPVELQHVERARTPSHPTAIELPNQWNEPVELQHTNSRRKEPAKPSHPNVVELANQWNDPVELQHTNSTRDSHPQVAELYNQWCEPFELPLTEPKPKHKKAPPPPRPPKSKPAVAELHNQWNDPVELSSTNSTRKTHRPAVAELPTSSLSAVSNALNSTNCAELPGSVFDDVDTLLGLAHIKSAPATLPSAPRPTHSPSISVSSQTGGQGSYLNNMPPKEVIDPHSIYAELPPENTPAPPPYTATAESSATFVPSRDIPEPAPFTFELSASASVRYTPQTRPVVPQRQGKLQSDPSIYNTLPGEGFPVVKIEPVKKDESRVDSQYSVGPDGRGRMNTYERATGGRAKAPPPPLPYPNSPAQRPVRLPYPVEPDVDPRTGRRWGS